MIMSHHHLEIFSQVLRLGIMNCLADEIALEAVQSTSLGGFDPPPSHLIKGSRDSLDLRPRVDHASTSKASNTPQMRRMSGLSTTDADTGLLSSIEFVSSEGMGTQFSHSFAASSRCSQESWTSMLMKSISFGRNGAAGSKDGEQDGVSPGGAAKDALPKKAARPSRFRAFKDRKPKTDQVPSRIPLFRSRCTPGKPRKDHWKGNTLFSFNKKPEVKQPSENLAADLCVAKANAEKCVCHLSVRFQNSPCPGI